MLMIVASRAGLGVDITGDADAVIVRLIPVAAPLVDVIANVVKTEAVRRETAHWLGAIFPSLPIVRQRLWRFVAPGGEGAFCSSAGSAFPLGFAGEPVGPASPGL